MSWKEICHISCPLNGKILQNVEADFSFWPLHFPIAFNFLWVAVRKTVWFYPQTFTTPWSTAINVLLSISALYNFTKYQLLQYILFYKIPTFTTLYFYKISTFTSLYFKKIPTFTTFSLLLKCLSFYHFYYIVKWTLVLFCSIVFSSWPTDHVWFREVDRLVGLFARILVTFNFFVCRHNSPFSCLFPVF